MYISLLLNFSSVFTCFHFNMLSFLHAFAYTGYTPLVHAVLGRHMSALKRLVTMGADLDIQDGQGRTCLSICAYQVRENCFIINSL